ncbi:hypothetical protein EI555_002906 [Monodon monoceros]|uniref:Uncharacterized protein n=1 Tax=Monodon monoceros TaxID=40151 RepID=A0A4U1F972_MONMO|nr:hypothetical protein EI555_002906 [Monodon monoceros]
MGAVTDDEVIRKRLLIDGDGAGDDRRINLQVKSFIKWYSSGSQEEGYSQYQPLLEHMKKMLSAKSKFFKQNEYEKIAKNMMHWQKHETLKELEALRKELEHLSHIKESVEDKLELRRKQFHVLLSTIHELQQTLENDEKLSEVEEAQENKHGN